MKNKNFLLSLPLLTVLWLFACHKDPPPPKPDRCPWPEITTEGLNTFGCKINGEEWVPCVDLNGLVVGLLPINSRLTESDSSNSFTISLSRSVYDSTYSKTNANALMTIWLKPCAIGQFEIPGLFEIARFGWYPKDSQYGYENIDTLTLNFFRISQLDTDKNIISGQFQMTLIEEQTGRKVEITDGRFDVKYHPQ